MQLLGTQRMKRSVVYTENLSEPKTISKSVITDSEMGDARIIKIDGDTRKLLTGNVKFKVYYKEGKTTYYLKHKVNDDTESEGEFTKSYNKNDNYIRISDRGESIIKGLLLDKDYYIEEINAHNGLYEKLSEPIELNVTDRDCSDRTALKRATYYIFSRKDVKKAMMSKYDKDEDGKLNDKEKKKYVKRIFSYICNKSEDEMKKYNFSKLAGLISGDVPKNAEIKEVVYSIINNDTYIGDDRISSILEQTDKLKAYVDKIKEFKELNAADKLVCYAYLRKQTPIVVENNKAVGALKIIKYDKDTGETLSGAEFTVFKVKDERYRWNVTTDEHGGATLEDLPVGEYTITETKAPPGYDLNLQEKKWTEKKRTITIEHTPRNPSEVEFYNKQYGNLKVTKFDFNTGKTDLDGIKLKDIKFKLYVVKNKKKMYLNNVDLSKNKLSYSYSDFNVEESDKAKAKTFTTNDSAQFIISNLPVYEGKNKITYYVEEYELPDNLKKFYTIKKDANSATLKNGKTVEISVTNKRKISISGYVWEDKVDNSKNTLRNNLCDKSETRVENLTVRLKYNDGKEIKTLDTKTTDSNGEYKFTNIEIENLSNYYVEFEYNGLKYQSVSKNLKKLNGSKATEKDDDRTHFNNLYAEITGGNEKGTNTKGYSKNESGKTTNVLTYKNGTYSSSLIENTGYNVSSANGSVTPQVYEGGGLSQGVTMRANTATAGYTFKLPEEGTEIINVNFGLYERAQPDISIATDLYTLDLSINGYSQTYTYNSRDQKSDINIYSELQKWNKTVEEMEAENDKYPRSYTRGIYKNYVYASGVDGDGSISDENKLKVDLKYKILINNESSLYMSANEIVNYFDNSLDYVNSYYQNDYGQDVYIKWETKEDKNEKKQLRTTELKDIKIPPNSSLCVYIVMRKNNVLKWKDEEKLNDETHSISEIASYSNYTKNADNTYSYYAGIDMDSAPDNIKLDDVSTYEDDTDSAPVLKITFLEPKTISGYVFEDKTPDDLKTGRERERKGDGKYNANEDGYVVGVTVELIDESSENDAYIYPNSVKADKAIYTTKKEERGYYEFVGIIPNKYYLKFTYGDGTVIYRNSDESSVNVTTESYKSTIITSNVVKSAYENVKTQIWEPKWYLDKSMKEGYSTAVDDFVTRKSINNKLSNITYGSKSGYDKKTKDYEDIQKISARTPEIEIFVEDGEYSFGYNTESGVSVYDNINFGIVERPRQSIEVKKEISYIKLILTNGQALVEGNPREGTLPYVKAPKGGGLTIEVDNEIIEGATLEVTYEIKIENNSEWDYDTEEYYKYGTYSKKDEPISMKINSIVDYMDENLKTTYTYDAGDGQWKLKKLNELKDENMVSSFIKSNNISNNILVNNCNIELKPGEEGKINVNASKLLSTANDMNYENYVEVLKASNAVGRFYGQRDEESSIKWKLISPGSLVIGKTETYEIDDSKAKLNIIPPTGENKNMIIYTIVGISCLSMVVVGIILIKKKVLD